MEKLIRPLRLAVLAILTTALLVVSVVTLYKLQIVEGRAYYEESKNNVVSKQTVAAARGNIMDRYGRVLVENRVCNNLLIDERELFPDLQPETITAANAALLRLASMVTAFGDSYTDTLPVTKAPPFEYTEMSDLQRVFLDAYLNDKDLPKTTSAVELMAFMRDRYQIDNSYTAEETRIIAGIRYEINGRYSRDFATADYVFAEDVGMDLITTLMESDVPGFRVTQSFVREYNTTYASHLLGYVGPMDAAQLPAYTKKGYSNDARIGQAGAEYAFEEYLHGTDGTARVTRTASGVVTSTVYTEATVPGNHVYLTIDIGLQEAAENALNSYILAENEVREKKNAEIETYGGDQRDIKQLITGGAAVAVDVKTGEPLAIASCRALSSPAFWSTTPRSSPRRTVRCSTARCRGPTPPAPRSSPARPSPA
jgi:penicillin-binding protein 2